MEFEILCVLLQSKLYLLSRDTHKPDIKCLLKLIYWKIVSFGFRPNC